MTDQQQLDTALSLARHGLYVFPLKTDGTKSPVKGMLWDDMATTDAEQIVTWWSLDYPGALIGIHAGRSGLHIIDVDEKGCDNPRHPEDCSGSGSTELERADITLPKTFSYRTPSGGQHVWTKAPDGVPLTIAQDYPVRHVDIRAGVGFVAYYGPALDSALKLAPAPENTLRQRSATSAELSDASATMTTWLDRANHGKASKPVKVARDAVTRGGMSRGDMLHAVTELVKLGTEPGAGAAYVAARSTYLADYPDHARSWDAAAEGSVKKFGLPPVTIPLTKPERKAIKQRAKEPAPPPARVIPENWRPKPSRVAGKRYPEDSPIAEEVADLLDGHWTYVTGTGLLRFDGKVWESAEELALVESVRLLLKEIVAEEIAYAVRSEDKRRIVDFTALLKRSKASAVTSFVTGILAARAQPLDADKDLLNAQNGIVDLRTGELYPHDPKRMMTKIAGCDYDPEAIDPLWDKALQAFPTKKVAAWMQARLGQALTGYTPDDMVMPICEGSGENGKSTVLDATRSAFGTYAVTVSDRLLLANPGDHPTELMQLRGARLAVTEELPEGRNLNVKRLKDVMGTEWITARAMRQDNVTYPATHAFIISTNYTPVVAETDHGTWRRVALVRFPFTFVKPSAKLVASTDRHGDPRLKPAFSVANPAVLAWLVKGAIEWYAAGRVMRPQPKTVAQDTLDWRVDADPILGYVRDQLELDLASAIPVRQLCDDFNRFLETRSQKRWSDTTIITRFTGHVSMPNVEKRKVRQSKALKWSLPQFSVNQPPETAVALVGVRFKTDPSRLSPSTEAGEFERITSGFSVDPEG